MKAVKKINLPDWLCNAQTQKIMSLIGGNVDNPQSMLVGGCVRNAVIGGAMTDIDIATQLEPQEIVEILNAANIKNIPTGIEHGTITAVIEGHPFEITTLRDDVETDGRHAKVVFTKDWSVDAHRRDFTMNSLFADMKGNVYDPVGQGIKDLEGGYVRFVGKARIRIEEDYLRILRYFRFYAQYGKGEFDQDALQACKEAADNISSLSKERITNEFLKILDTDLAPKVLAVMYENQVLSEFNNDGFEPEFLSSLIELQKEYSAPNTMSRYFVVMGNKARFHDEFLRLPHASKNFLIKLEMVSANDFFKDEKSLKRAIYYHGNDLLLQGYLVFVASGRAVQDDDMIALMKDWQAPAFPVTGETLLAEGYQTGPELGQELSRREEEWLETVI